jgi:4-amino-4-deoxy-L-arabinose transferase-like glycosyltransferase
MHTLFNTVENKILGALSLGFFFNSFFFVAREVKSMQFLTLTQNTHAFYFVYILLGLCLTGTLLFFSDGWQWRKWAVSKLLVLFPTASLIIFGLTQSRHFHFIFQIFAGLYIIACFFVLIAWHHRKETTLSDKGSSVKAWFATQKRSTLIILVLLVLVNLSFGSYRIAQFAAVDEALWTFGGRISKYWTNMAEQDWNGTRVSDKPGVTVSIISGAGLLFETPKDYRSIKFEGSTYHPKNDIKKLNFALRFPMLLFAVFMLPVFYFFLERVFGQRKALISTLLIGTSPTLLGMERIINPDSLLWIFAPLSILSSFTFLKRKTLVYLYWTGVFLGLALLTKYVANILFVFFFGMIFLEYIFLSKETRFKTSITTFLKSAFLNYGIITVIALSLFYLLYPAVWVKPQRLLDATLLSQAFKSTWPIFISIISFVFVDQWTMRNKITQSILDIFAEHKHFLASIVVTLFLASILFASINTWLGMPWYDFESILASPKSAYAVTGFLGIFLGNFYPLLFSIHPLALLALIALCLCFFVIFVKQAPISFGHRAELFLIVFFLLYYLGTTVNHVATISRYQIMLFPLAFILAGNTLARGIITLSKLARKRYAFATFSFGAGVLFIILITSLSAITPLYSGYASGLLPQAYHTDIKDMGDGSYEAAVFLNTLPDAKHLVIWSDKKGVCTFFVGDCYSSFNYNSLITKHIDFVVVSSGRESRTTKMVQGSLANQKPNVIRFDQYYQRTDGTVFWLMIDHRPGNFVKVFPF